VTHLDLFTGILGFSLAAQWVWGEEYELVACCEIDPFCQKIIRKHFPEVPIIEDIKKVQWVIADSATMFGQEEFGGEQDRILQQVQIPPIDLLTAGFPCQPFSNAGRRAGTGDDRYLWPETIRTIREVGPTYVVLENVAGLLSILEPSSLSEMEVKEIELFQQDESIEVSEIVERIHRRIISRIIDDLKQAGYLLPALADGTPIILCLPACGVGAPHRRDRIWIVANSGCGKSRKCSNPYEMLNERDSQKGSTNKVGGSDCDAKNARNRRLSECGAEREGGKVRQIREASPNNVEKTNCLTSDSNRFNGDDAGHGSGEVSQFKEAEISECNSTNTHKQGSSFREVFGRNLREECKALVRNPWQEHWYEVATRLCRVDDGVPRRVDRLKSLGNAIVPQVAEEIFRAIKAVEEHKED
jgi:DNA (cytosine-5)-methyltransferase 1